MRATYVANARDTTEYLDHEVAYKNWARTTVDLSILSKICRSDQQQKQHEEKSFLGMSYQLPLQSKCREGCRERCKSMEQVCLWHKNPYPELNNPRNCPF